MSLKRRARLAWPLAILALLLLVQFARRSADATRILPFTQFEQALSEGRIADIEATDTLLVGRLKQPDGATTALATVRVEPELAAQLKPFGVPYSRVHESSFVHDLLTWLAPLLMLVAFWWVAGRAARGRSGLGGLIGAGSSHVKVHFESDTGVTFADVAGVDEAKAELEEVVDFLQNPRDYERLGAHIPRGVLLVGPPGTGKTMLAKAVAGQARVPFFSITGSEFVEMFVGVGAARVRDLFAQARQHAPSIVFIDELDALGRARGAFDGFGSNDEKEQTLNQLLGEMDGFDTASGVVILAATNRPEVLDPALLRAGRFDRQVLVDRPDRSGRIAILAVHVRKIHVDPALALESVAGLTAGFSGAELANLVNEAALVATRRKAQVVELQDFTEAVERLVAGLEKKSRVLNTRERETVAYHEMGHALVAVALEGGDAVRKVSIIPHGIGALGYTLQGPLQDRYVMTRVELEGRLAVLLGGRAAECLVFGEGSTGASDDLAKATDIAIDMVTRHGMDDALGPVAYDRGPAPLPELPRMPWVRRQAVSEDTQRRIDEAVRTILANAYDHARVVLTRCRPALDRCARELLEHETLDEAAIRRLVAEPVSAASTTPPGAGTASGVSVDSGRVASAPSDDERSPSPTKESA
jgi:cell division protease FtsH